MDRAYLIHKGEVVYEGAAEQLVNDPKAREIYLGPGIQPVSRAQTALCNATLVTVERFYTEHASALELNLVAGASGLKRIIREPTVNRPGLVLSGFTRYFANKRVQVIGNAEAYFLKSLARGGAAKRYETFFSYKIPCVVFSRNLHPDKLFLKAAEAGRGARSSAARW